MERNIEKKVIPWFWNGTITRDSNIMNVSGVVESELVGAKLYDELIRKIIETEKYSGRKQIMEGNIHLTALNRID